MVRLFRRRGRRRATAEELTICTPCRSDFVSPVDWAEHDETSWWIRLRCGHCGEEREVVLPQEAADRYDRALDRTSVAIAATLDRLDRERMTAEVESFVTALALDLLDAADFAVRPVHRRAA